MVQVGQFLCCVPVTSNVTHLRFLALLTILAASARGSVHVREVAIDGVIHPVTTEIVSSAIQDATNSGDALLIVRLDTPGGLLEAMRQSIAKLVNAPIPIVTFVAPRGARAASAGFFLLEAADIAAMAPGTNTGAAHPVIMGAQMDPVMKEKLENDAAASLRSITAQRGRNVSLAESAVRQSKSFTEREALDGHLIEIIATDENDLLRQIDGRPFKRFDGKTIVLHLAGATVVRYDLTVRQRVFAALSDPNLALIVLALGVLGIYVEFSAPGLIFPGVIGSILALLGLAAFSLLPLNWLGVTLILLSLLLFGLEVKFFSHGILSAGGAVALVAGALMLVDSPSPEMRIHPSTAFSVALPLALITAALVVLAIRARRAKVVTGAEGMIGQMGVALDEISPNGRVLVRGENWQARADLPIARGAPVRVSGMKDLLLFVERSSAQE